MAFFSLEMTDVQLANRLMSNACGIEGKKLLNGQLDREDWNRLDKNVGILTDAPLYIDDTEGLSVMDLRTKARRLKKEHQIELIMIDYLQLMTASGMRYNSRQEEVSLVSRSLKGLAKELNIPVIALSQLNRGVESRDGAEGKRPQLSDLRESGAIERGYITMKASLRTDDAIGLTCFLEWDYGDSDGYGMDVKSLWAVIDKDGKLDRPFHVG